MKFHLVPAAAIVLLLSGCGMPEEDQVFDEMTVRDVADAIDRKETFAVYFGFEACPWCAEAEPVLKEEALKADMRVGYVDTRKDPSWKSNTDLADYDLVLRYFGEYLSYDNDGVKHLYTPHVFFVRDGKTVSEHEGTCENHNAAERKMNDSERSELAEVYRHGFELLIQN